MLGRLDQDTGLLHYALERLVDVVQHEQVHDLLDGVGDVI
jgi:hypothetical protein